MIKDRTFLEKYTSHPKEGGRSRQALDELIRRHLDLVYSAALRQVRDHHLAEDVTQAVFLILAQKAQTIRDSVAVAGWLLAVTRRTAVHAMKRRSLDRRREEACAKPDLAPAVEAPWEEIAPALDGALNRLPQVDRDAIVLRVLENQSLAQVGAELGISQEAAKKRVSRALSHLRKFLQSRGISTGAAALSATLATRAVHAAPAHLLTTTLSGTVSSSVAALTQGTLRAMALSTAKLAAAVALGLLLLTFLSAATYSFTSGARPPVAVSIAPSPTVAALAAPVAAPPTVAAPMRPTPIFNWKTSDDFSLARDFDRSQGITVDNAGNVYVAGFSQDAAVLHQHAIIREKLAGTENWTTILDLPDARLWRVVFDSAGNLLAYGEKWNATLRHLPDPNPTYDDFAGPLVLKRTVGQTAFSVLDQAEAFDGVKRETLLADGTGNMFLFEYEIEHVGEQNEKLYAVVRKLAPGDSNFKTVFKSDLSKQAWIDMTVIPSGPNAGLYLAGVSLAPVTATHVTAEDRWLVHKSVDGGATWTTVDNFHFAKDPDAGCAPSAITSDSAGNIYVAGLAQDDSPYARPKSDADASFNRLLIRKSADGGKSWTTPYGTASLFCRAMLQNDIGLWCDNAQNLYLLQEVLQAQGSIGGQLDRAHPPPANTPVVRLLYMHVDTRWVPLAPLNGMTGKSSGIGDLAFDASGNLYFNTVITDTANRRHWLVRSSPPPTFVETALP